MRTRCFIASCMAVGLPIMFTVATGSAALAASANVQSACMDDYQTFCSKHDPLADSAGVSACMKAHGGKLSQRCVAALVAEGTVTKAELGSRAAKK